MVKGMCYFIVFVYFKCTVEFFSNITREYIDALNTRTPHSKICDSNNNSLT